MSMCKDEARGLGARAQSEGPGLTAVESTAGETNEERRADLDIVICGVGCIQHNQGAALCNAAHRVPACNHSAILLRRLERIEKVLGC